MMSTSSVIYTKSHEYALKQVKAYYAYNNDAKFEIPYGELPHIVEVETHRTGFMAANPLLEEYGLQIVSVSAALIERKGLVITFAVLAPKRDRYGGKVNA